MKHEDSIEINLIRLDRLNYNLADELEKLPEIRKFRTHSSCLALSNLLKIYQFAPDEFDRMFEAMNEIGIPSRRKYCSPLQALFWLVLDGKMRVSGMLLGLKINKRTESHIRCQALIGELSRSVQCANNGYRPTSCRILWIL